MILENIFSFLQDDEFRQFISNHPRLKIWGERKIFHAKNHIPENVSDLLTLEIEGSMNFFNSLENSKLVTLIAKEVDCSEISQLIECVCGFLKNLEISNIFGDILNLPILPLLETLSIKNETGVLKMSASQLTQIIRCVADPRKIKQIRIEGVEWGNSSITDLIDLLETLANLPEIQFVSISCPVKEIGFNFFVKLRGTRLNLMHGFRATEEEVSWFYGDPPDDKIADFASQYDGINDYQQLMLSELPSLYDPLLVQEYQNTYEDILDRVNTWLVMSNKRERRVSEASTAGSRETDLVLNVC